MMLRLVRGEVPQMRDSGQYFPGCRPPTRQHANLEVGTGAQMPVVPNAALQGSQCCSNFRYAGF
jgi:hypothetical protein